MFTIGSFAIIFDSEKRILLCHRRDIDAWNLPGGLVESGELPTEAVIRETLEETGLNIEIERLAGIYGKADKDEFVFSFVARVVGGKIKSTDEADECIYFSLDEFPENTSPKRVEGDLLIEFLFGVSFNVDNYESLIRKWQASDEQR